MEYLIAYHTDIGMVKETNQDSMAVLEAKTEKGNVLFAIICDGMGGLAKGEVASTTLIHVFTEWFEKEFSAIYSQSDLLDEVKYAWDRMIKTQNQNIAEYGRNNGIQLGTTLTAMLILEDGNYIISHVGDTRVYKITDNSIDVLTMDQTVAANQFRLGKITKEEAENDPRRSVLLQCIGASRVVEPDYIIGKAEQGEEYMFCSDGFRHEISEEEIFNALKPSGNNDEIEMKMHLVELVEKNKQREETDNITSFMLKIIR